MTVRLHGSSADAQSAPVIVPAGVRPELTLGDVVAGTVGVIRNGLQDLGLFDGVVDATLRQVGEVISPEARRELSAQGFEKFHQVLTPRQAFDVRYALETTLRDLSFRMVNGFVGTLPGPRPNVYICRHTYVRVMMPEDVVATERELLADEFGHMIVHAPHRDSWFSHCSNTVNLWVAIGRVLPGNGMLVYPDAWGREPGHDGTKINRSARLGVPYNFDLGPGDILVFSGEQVHSSEVNITDETRYVLTTRFTVGRPRYSRGVGWIPYHDARLLDGPWRSFSSSMSRMTTAYARHVQRGAQHQWRRLTAGGGR
jgi:hypothetical protein